MRTQSPWEDPLLLWWVQCVDILDELTPRNRARALSLVAEDLRQALADARGRAYLSPWLTDQFLSQEPDAPPPRTWRVAACEDGMRIVG